MSSIEAPSAEDRQRVFAQASARGLAADASLGTLDHLDAGECSANEFSYEAHAKWPFVAVFKGVGSLPHGVWVEAGPSAAFLLRLNFGVNRNIGKISRGWNRPKTVL